MLNKQLGKLNKECVKTILKSVTLKVAKGELL